MTTREIVVIGGGPAGMAAALAAREAGVRDVLVLDREPEPGGILRQCIHNGFGLHKLGRELTGPEYADVYRERVEKEKIEVLCNTTVTGLTADRVVTAQNEKGILRIKAGAVVLAMGCRERPRGALGIPGDRPAGVITAGTAQRFINLMGKMPGRRVVILGSGDIGLIMARRLVFSGAEVLAAVEIMPQSAGLQRNVVQCLEDFGIPLLLSHTVTEVRGRERVEAVTVAQVDGDRHPIPGTERVFDCDTLMLSVGLIPENELTRAAGARMDARSGGPVVDDTLQTTVPGVFACGNVLHVHGLVDNVSTEAAKAGRAAAEFVRGK